MDNADRTAIDELFARIGEVEQKSPPRDVEAERLIQAYIGRQPAAPYYLAQTIIAQEQALEAAQQRITDLEQQSARQSAGGILSAIFGGARRQPRFAAPRHGHSGWTPSLGHHSHGHSGYRSGGGFLAGAAQTAMGVAGGVLLGNMISDMFDGSEAQAASMPSDAEDAGSSLDDASYDGGGFDDSSFGSGGFEDFGGDEF